MKRLSLLMLVLAAFVTANAQPLLVGHRGSYWGVENTEEAFINSTQKSKNGKARCDIMLSLKNSTAEYSIAIELKHFKKSEGETITDNRFSILCDIENLENYKQANSKLEGYQIIYTDNPNYTNPKSTSYIKIGEGVTLDKGRHTSNGRTVELENRYIFKWDTYENNHCFLKIKV